MTPIRERETWTRAGSPSQVLKLPDCGVEFGNMILLSYGTWPCTGFRAILCFAYFDDIYGFELEISLCFQIGNIPFVLLLIKRRVFSVFWKVVRVSGAGQYCARYTVSGWRSTDNISILTS